MICTAHNLLKLAKARGKPSLAATHPYDHRGNCHLGRHSDRLLACPAGFSCLGRCTMGQPGLADHEA
jgi:hypothetical protein